MNQDCVAQWLKRYVGSANVVDSFWGKFDLQNELLEQNVGAIYGIWVKATTQEIESYCRTNNKTSMKSFGGYLPIYWGKDISPCSRLAIHLKTPKGTGGLDLVNSSAYAGKDLIFGCILTKSYAQYEKKLHKEYPPIQGSDKSGKSSKTRKILE